MIEKLKELNIINDELKSIYEFDEYTLTELICSFYNVIKDLAEKIENLENQINENIEE